ncbi:MAG: GNAT family N-acetyltransferase [Eubacterium sp.]|nr:GNAT family N-acetyltransferase [Eubacterium sp.]
MDIKKVEDAQQINLLAAIADEIWHEYFGIIISDEQIDYMVEKFQSEHAITSQIQNDGYEYYMFYIGDEPIGYNGIKPEKDALFLSKLYIKKEHRSKGYASKAFEFLTDYCKNHGLKYIYLTVNRRNDDTINIYKKKGFYVTEEKCADIGNGFVMDDYIMRLDIK